MSTAKRYRLKVDFPGTKSGAVFTENYGDDTYEYNSDNGEDCSIRRHSVEHFPEWFELIPNVEAKPVFDAEKINKRLNELSQTISIADVIEVIRRYCDGTYSNDYQDWDLPKKASEIIIPLEEAARKKQEVKEDAFVWTDELVKVFWMGNTSHRSQESLNNAIQQFKASKQSRPTPEYSSKGKDWEVTKTYALHGVDGWPTVIQEVKRISDGDIFGVGNTINVAMPDDRVSADIIKSFYEECGGMWIRTENNGTVGLSEISRPPQPSLHTEPPKQHLFITEDGVKIFEGDKYWFVTPSDTIHTLNAIKSQVKGKYEYFSTESAAKEYIAKQKEQEIIERFKYDEPCKWGQPAKQQEKERIEVVVFNNGYAGEGLSVRTKNGNSRIPVSKNEEIKSAIESVINS